MQTGAPRAPYRIKGIFKRFFQLWKMDIRESLARISRVMQVASKPTKDEFGQSAKITGAGLLLIGATGFVIFLAAMLLGGNT